MTPIGSLAEAARRLGIEAEGAIDAKSGVLETPARIKVLGPLGRENSGSALRQCDRAINSSQN
jgi:hypothetical protein